MFLVPKSLKLAVIWEADETEYIVDRYAAYSSFSSLIFLPFSLHAYSDAIFFFFFFSSFSHLEKKIIACLFVVPPNPACFPPHCCCHHHLFLLLIIIFAYMCVNVAAMNINPFCTSCYGVVSSCLVRQRRPKGPMLYVLHLKYQFHSS